jgi:hypothetical protein
MRGATKLWLAGRVSGETGAVVQMQHERTTTCYPVYLLFHNPGETGGAMFFIAWRLAMGGVLCIIASAAWSATT